VTGTEGKPTKKTPKISNDALIIAQLVEQLDDEKRQFLIDFIKWLKLRKNHAMPDLS